MKSVFIFIIAMVICSKLQAQSKIGARSTDMIDHTALELSATDKALTLPYVALKSLIDKTMVLDPIAGMTVYNTTNAGTGANKVFANCLYIFNGSTWEVLVDKTALTGLGTPTVYGTGRSTGIKYSQITDKLSYKLIDLNDKDAVINADGSIKPVQPGYYRFSVRVRWYAINDVKYYPLLGTPSTGVSYLFSGPSNLPSDQTVAYSGTVYLDGNTTSGFFSLNYGNGQKGSTLDYYDMAEVVWVYLGNLTN